MKTRKRNIVVISLPGKQVCIAGVFTLAASAATAWLIESGRMQFKNTGYAAMGILLISGVICGRAGKGGRQRILGVAAGTAYLLGLLIINLLFFGGQITGMGVTIIVFALGIALGILPQKKKGRGHSRYKIPGQ